MSKTLAIVSEILVWCVIAMAILAFLPFFFIAAFFGAFLGGLFEG